MHMFLQLVGQTVDTQKLRDIRKLLGFTIAGRTGAEEDSREAIGVRIAAQMAGKGAEGTAYLRVAQRQPRKFRFFYSSAEFVPRADDSGLRASRCGPAPGSSRARSPSKRRPTSTACWPRRSTPPQRRRRGPAPAGRAVKIVDGVIGSLQATGCPADARYGCRRWPQCDARGTGAETPTVDDLVARLRGKPWDVGLRRQPGPERCRWRWRTAPANTARTCAAWTC